MVLQYYSLTLSYLIQTIMRLVYPQNLHNYCLLFLPGQMYYPGEIGNNVYVKFWGVNKAHYCLGENVQYSECNTQEKLETMFM